MKGLPFYNTCMHIHNQCPGKPRQLYQLITVQFSVMDDITERAKLLASIVADPSTWDAWVINNPSRLAKLLGTCTEGEYFIAEAALPFLKRIQSLLLGRKESAHPATNFNHQNKRRYDMPNEKETKEASETLEATREGIALAGKLLELLQIGLKSKKKADKLKALVTAWEQTGLYKDLLISVYENGKINNPQQKKKAQEIRKKLQEIQELLRTIREKIESDEGYSTESKKLDKLLREVIEMLINL
jgi:hypothetical protein